MTNGQHRFIEVPEGVDKPRRGGSNQSCQEAVIGFRFREEVTPALELTLDP